METILKTNNLTQFNIYQKTDIDKQGIEVSNKMVQDVPIQKEQNSSKIVLKRNIETKYTSPRDIVFSILSEEGRRKANEDSKIKSKPNGERFERNTVYSVSDSKQKEEKENISIDSVTFLLKSGFSTQHFERLFSKVGNIIQTLLCCV